MAELLSDLLLAALLLASVIWSALLHRRLARLRADRKEIEGFIAALAATTERAEAAIGGLRSAGSTVSRDLQTQEETVQRSIERLSRAIESGNRTIRRLEQLQSTPMAASERGRAPASARASVEPAKGVADSAASADASPPSAGRIPDEVMRVLQALR